MTETKEPTSEQVRELKASYPGSLLLFGVGHQLVSYGDDARDVADALALALDVTEDGRWVCRLNLRDREFAVRLLNAAGRTVMVCEPTP